MLCPIERVFGQQVHEGHLFRFGFMNGFDGGHQTVFEPGVLLFDKSGKFGVRGCPPQRHHQHPYDREDKGGNETKPQGNYCP